MLLRTRRGLIEFGRARPQPREAIARLLHEIGSTPSGERYLRAALADVISAPMVEGLSADELYEQVAAHILKRNLAFVFLRPYDAVTPGFTVEGDAAVVAKDQKNEAEDLKPAPEIPPEYPVLARQESDQVISSTSQLTTKLAALAFGTFGHARRQSTIARTLVTAAAEQGARILSARQTTDISLEIGKWAEGGPGRPKPTVPIEYKSAAKSTGEMAKFAVDKLAASLGPHDSTKS